MIVFAVFVLAQMDSWAPRLDPVWDCLAKAADRPFPVEVDNPSNPPAGVWCEQLRPWNIALCFPFLLLIVAGWTIRDYIFADQNREAVSIYRPHDEVGRITIRYALTVNWPETIEINVKDLEGLSEIEVRQRLVDRMADHVNVDIEPFADDVDFVSGVQPLKPADIRERGQRMISAWWIWCLNEADSYCVINAGPDENEDAAETEIA